MYDCEIKKPVLINCVCYNMPFTVPFLRFQTMICAPFKDTLHTFEHFSLSRLFQSLIYGSYMTRIIFYVKKRKSDKTYNCVQQHD